MSKYERFKERAKIIRDPNKKPCPKPDCESYLEKNPNKKYVTALIVSSPLMVNLLVNKF